MRRKIDESSQGENNPFHLFSRQKKIHPAIEYLRQLQRHTASPQLEHFLSSFAKPKLVNYDNFVTGVKKFIELANSNPVSKENNRKAIYGNNYSGLHYNNDLVKLWNAEHPDQEPLKASAVTTFAPDGWDSTSQDGFITLIYRGQQPSQALDDLVKGPTAIDCGMFAQLSLWFGIRYMLGNERFNQCFGRAPFFITQSVYNGIEESSQPFSGNPLYSFLVRKDRATTPSVRVRHLANTPLYPFKHPGGNYGGENCIVIGDQYYIFDPHLEHTQGVTEADVLNLLRESFNQVRQPYDNNRLSLYAAKPEELHPKFFQTFGQLVEAAKQLQDKTLSEEEFAEVEQNPALELNFDLEQFSVWLQYMEHPMEPDVSDYLPQPIDHALMPAELLDVVPFENRTSMDFSKFKQESPQQKELMIISKQFCQSIMIKESRLVILTGKAGVGKTASAVCAAKELTAKGKKIVWISEVMVNRWAQQATSIAELDNCRVEIDKLLASNPDAVFLDDDNLHGFSGNLLLEKIYSWYVNNPGKGLFITSNEPIQFKDCYGYNLDGKYHYPPFSEYCSSQYLNWQYKTDLAGMSLRSKREGQSIGAVVSDLVWKIHKDNLGEFELIPGFDSEDLPPISRNLGKTGSLHCSAYDKLSDLQKEWVKENKGEYWDERGHHRFHIAITKKFAKTTYKTIALEMREYNSLYFGKRIDSDSMDQLIRVLNYAHDQGGRRIILINQTSFSSEELLIQIKAQLPKAETERTWSRLMLLLCDTEHSIFDHDQFNGHIEVTPPRQPVTAEETHDVGHSAFKKNYSALVKLFFPGNQKRALSASPERKMIAHAASKKTKISSENSEGFFSSNEKDDVTVDRHDGPEIQQESDNQFGLFR